MLTSKPYAYILRVALLFLLYFLTATFGLGVDAVSGFATYIWFPTGISLAFLLLFGIRLFPAIFLGAFLVNFLNGAPIPVATGIGIGNTLEAVMGVLILRQFANFSMSLERLNDVLRLIVVAIFATMISASIGVFSLFLGGIVSLPSLPGTWVAWWIGDMVSVLIVTPVILTLQNIPVVVGRTPQKVFELIALFSTLFIISIIIFRNPTDSNKILIPFTYLVYTPLIWGVLRFGPSVTVLAIFILSIFTTISTIQGLGPFAHKLVSESLFSLESFMAVLSISCLMLASAVAERKHLAAQKDEFFSIASHELKTPITAVKVYAQFIEKEFRRQKDIKNAHLVVKINMQIDRLVKLISEMLEVSRIDAGRLNYSRVAFNLNALVSKTVADLQYVTEGHKLKRIGSIRQKIMGDPDRISQVITNLIMNASYYSPKGSRIIVRLEEQKNTAVVSVQDFGIGISEDMQKKIFERFFRVKQNKIYHHSGFGLGLFISSRIVKRHGGKMWVVSKKGKGSTFFFTLPY